jgi:hypothetical protein
MNSLGRLELADLPPGRAFGLLPVEEEGGRRFRWTRAVALLELPIAASAGELRLEIAPLRPADAPLCLWAFVNGRRLPPAAVRVEPELITIDLTAARLKDDREQRLALTVAPIEQWRDGSPDRRELGLPLAAVEAH